MKPTYLIASCCAVLVLTFSAAPHAEQHQTPPKPAATAAKPAATTASTQASSESAADRILRELNQESAGHSTAKPAEPAQVEKHSEAPATRKGPHERIVLSWRISLTWPEPLRRMTPEPEIELVWR